MKVMQLEREQRHAVKRGMRGSVTPSSASSSSSSRNNRGSSPPSSNKRYNNDVDDKLVAEFANDPSSELLFELINHA